MSHRLKRVPSGVAGLDVVLQGGFLEAGVYIFIGEPGAGKTILANQIAFHHATHGGQVVYISLLAESHSRLFAHMEEMAFFTEGAVTQSLHYASGYQALEQDGLNGLLALIRREVRERKASMLVLDGLVSAEAFAQNPLALKKFVHELQTMVSLMSCTAFLLTSGSGDLRMGQPEHTMVDGLVELEHKIVGVRQMRTLHVRKFRGSNSLAGTHAFVISSRGITVYPRLEARVTAQLQAPPEDQMRCGSGVHDLDAILGGGLDRGSPTLVLGPAGSGKTLCSLAFLRAGLENGEPATYFGFHESPPRLLSKAARIGIDLAPFHESGALDIRWQPNVDFLCDQLVDDLLESIAKRKTRRLVIDSLAGLKGSILVEERLPRFFSALANELRVMGVTAYFVDETPQLFRSGFDIEVPVTGLSAIVDNIIFLRQVEHGDELHRIACVLKTREYEHDSHVRTFTISSRGIAFDGTRAAAKKKSSKKKKKPSSKGRR